MFAHRKLGIGSYPLDKIRPEVLKQVDAMTAKLVKDLESQETRDPEYRELASYLERQMTRLMSEPKNRIFFQNVPRIRVHILPTKDVNAFATASGDIYVFLGLIPYMKHQNMLTAVLAHELIHVSRAHVPRLLDKYWDQIPHDSAKMTLESWSDILSGVGKIAKVMALKVAIARDKRMHETEADDIAAELMDNAGISAWYFKFAMQSFERFTKMHDSPTPNRKVAILKRLLAVFADHPATADRVARTADELKRHGYRDFRETGSDGRRRKTDAIDPRYLEIYKRIKAKMRGPRP